MILQTIMPPDASQISDIIKPVTSFANGTNDGTSDGTTGITAGAALAGGLFVRGPSFGVSIENGVLVINKDCELSFDTCFGCFLTQKWLRYTTLSSLWVEAEISGDAELSVDRAYYADGELSRETVVSASPEASDSHTVVRMNIGEVMPGSMYYLTVRARGETRLWDAYFGCDNDDDADEINISAAICTYKRERYVENTLSLFDKNIFKNPASPLRGHFNVYVSDNAHTLDADSLQNEYVRIFPNKNLGGTGGFTRCMMEITEREPACTHILLADDDAVIPIRSIEIIYSFLRLLKPEHKDITAGGALWRLDMPWEQFEAGAGWDGCHVIGHSAGADLRSPTELLDCSLANELNDFSGWWLTCVPVSRVRSIGLPLPLFLHRDDIEYGLRLRGRIVIPDGVGVWHESFDKRMTGLSEYYDLRNMLIVNAIHRPNFTKCDYTAFVKKWYLRNLYSHRYRYIEMNLSAVRDALAGFDHFFSLDPVELNDRLRELNYKLTDINELDDADGIAERDMFRSDHNRCPDSRVSASPLAANALSALTVLLGGGLWLPAKKRVLPARQPTPIWKFFRSGTIIHCDADNRGYVTKRDRSELRRCRRMWRETCLLINERYDQACADYRAHWTELITEDFWEKYLYNSEFGIRNSELALGQAHQKTEAL